MVFDYLHQGFRGLTGLTLAIASSTLAAPALAFNLTTPQPLYTTAGDPAALRVQPGQGYDGVVRLLLANSLCSGSLLSTGAHILTAAHCLPRSQSGPVDFSASVSFTLPSGSVSLGVNQFFLPTEWTGNWEEDAWKGYDLALLELVDLAPAAAERYELYRDRDEVGQVADKVGYGRSGTGETGDTLRAGLKRAGQNRYDATGDFFSWGSDRLLLYDFDSGRPENDFFGGDLGLGALEVMAAPGDSGGPSFINGRLAGVTSWRLGNLPTDIDRVTNSSFGEVGGDVRVSSHLSWIESILQAWRPPQPPGEPQSVPEPGVSWVLLGFVGGLLWWRRSRA